MNVTNDRLINIINELVRTRKGLTEIELNGPGLLFIKEDGVRKQVRFNLNTQQEYNAGMKGLIEAAGLSWNDFLVEGRLDLPNGKTSRLHVTMPPVSSYPTATIAIKTDDLSDIGVLHSVGMFNSDILRFLKAAVGARMTVVISGGSGAGKTTLLEGMTKEFELQERVGVCEDSPELQLQSPNTAYLNATVWAPGQDPNNVATLAWCVQQINRMRVDRVIVGETRGREFFDFITAANSGIEGSMTTIHANDVDATMKKMTSFMYMAEDLNPRIINEMIADAVDIVIQLGRSKVDGSIKIVEIAEVTNQMTAGDSPRIATNKLFEYVHEDDDWVKRYPTDKMKEKLSLHGFDPNNYRRKEREQVQAKPVSTGDVGLPSYFKGGVK